MVEGYKEKPVIDETGRVIGKISESLLALYPSEYDQNKRVDEIDIEGPFPMVNKETKLSTIKHSSQF